MIKEILLYSPIYSFSAEAFVNSMEENKNADIVVRLNTDGGSPEDGWSMLAKFMEHTGKKLVKVDGRANSMGLYFLCYADDSECLDVSQFVLHRAAYSEWVEKNPNYMTDAMWQSLNAVNSKLRAALESKIDVKKFEKLKKVSLDDVFSTESRIDVTLTAEEAKKIGLVKRVVAITPEKKAEISSLMYKIAAYSVDAQSEIIIKEEEVKPLNTKKMNIEKLKTENPDLFKEVLALGASQERDRAGAWLAFIAVDADAVAKGIKEGKEMSATTMAELALKSVAGKKISEIEGESPAAIVTEEPTLPTVESDKKKAAFEAEVIAMVSKK